MYCHEESGKLPLKFDFIGGMEFLSQTPSIDQPIEPSFIWMAGTLVPRLRCGAGKFLAFLVFFLIQVNFTALCFYSGVNLFTCQCTCCFSILVII